MLLLAPTLVRNINFRYGGRQFTAFHRLIACYNYCIEHVCGRLESDVILVFARHEFHFHYIVAHITAIKTGNAFRNGNGEFTVDIRNDTDSRLVIPAFLQIISRHIDGSPDERQIIFGRNYYTPYLPVCGKGVTKGSYQ